VIGRYFHLWVLVEHNADPKGWDTRPVNKLEFLKRWQGFKAAYADISLAEINKLFSLIHEPH
jgi:hypothetical protein